jgi:DNA adenine methylase
MIDVDDSMNSPFRYAGGKFYARKQILAKLPEHKSYIEPFAGGASIFFAKTKVAKSHLNDIDTELINTFIHIRDYPDELAERVSCLVPTKEAHKFYKNEFKPTNEMDSAVRWYFLNRISYSGIMNMQNCYWGYGEKFSMRPENWTRNILRTSKKLQGVKLTSWDFSKVISKAPTGSFLFIDPPYFNADQDKFYQHFFQKEQHYSLEAVLKEHSSRLKFLLTYDNCPEITSLYSWVGTLEPAEWNYTIARTDDQKKKIGDEAKTLEKGIRTKGKELFIMNYPMDLLRTNHLQ